MADGQGEDPRPLQKAAYFFFFFLFCDHSYTFPFHASTMTNLCLLALLALMRISFGSRVSICTRRSIGRWLKALLYISDSGGWQKGPHGWDKPAGAREELGGGHVGGGFHSWRGVMSMWLAFQKCARCWKLIAFSLSTIFSPELLKLAYQEGGELVAICPEWSL